MSGEYFNCKVCETPIARYRGYQPRICEACRKFFTRTSHAVLGKRLKLICSFESKCYIMPEQRRDCRRCRYERCLSVGMKSKLAHQDGIDDAENELSCGEPLSAESTCEGADSFVMPEQEANHTSLVQEPVIFDGSAIESIMQTVIRSFTHLHGLEFVMIKHENICGNLENLSQFLEITMADIVPVCVASLSYSFSFIGCEGFGNLSHGDVRMLARSAAMSHVIALFYNLPSHSGASFCGINDRHLPALFSWFPELEPFLPACKKLAEALDNWRPSMIETALLAGLLLFTGYQQLTGYQNVKLVKSCRRRLLLAVNLLSSKNDQQFSDRPQRNYFELCFQLAQDAGGVGLKLQQAIQSRMYGLENKDTLNSHVKIKVGGQPLILTGQQAAAIYNNSGLTSAQ